MQSFFLNTQMHTQLHHHMHTVISRKGLYACTEGITKTTLKPTFVYYQQSHTVMENYRYLEDMFSVWGF